MHINRWMRSRRVLSVVACMSIWIVAIMVRFYARSPYLSIGDSSRIEGRRSSQAVYDPPSAPTSNPILDTALLTPTNSAPSFQIANGTRYALVHVGKTAGSKIGCEVLSNPDQLKCDKRKERRRRRLQSPLGRASVCRLHLNSPRRIKECQENPFDTFLFALRNPLDRMVSYFYYERDEQQEREGGCSRTNRSCRCRLHSFGGTNPGCFRNVDEFAKSAVVVPVEPNMNITASERKQTDCQELAFDVATGKEPCRLHNSFNYEYYVHLTKEFMEGSAMYPILVIRQEHLGEDWDKLEAAFGGSSHETDTYRLGSDIFSEKVNNRDVKKFDNLSDIGRENLCFALCREIQVYKYILYQAQNLNELQMKQSISEVMDVCPEESFHIRDCSPDTDGISWPNIYKNSTFDIKKYISASGGRFPYKRDALPSSIKSSSTLNM